MMFDTKIEKLSKDMTEKEKRMYQIVLEIHERLDDMNEYYTTWSKATEKGWQSDLDESSQFRKATQGRVSVTFVKKKLGRPEETAEDA